jgi:hypothetical protein
LGEPDRERQLLGFLPVIASAAYADDQDRKDLAARHPSLTA